MHLNLLMAVFNQVGVGTYWRAYGFASELANRGHEVTLICAGLARQNRLKVEKTDGVILVTFPSTWKTTQGSGYDPKDIFSRYRWLRRSSPKYDVVHAFESRPATLIPALIARRNGAIFISDWCDWFGSGGSIEHRTSSLQRIMMRPIETFLENRSRLKTRGVSVINSVLREKVLSMGIDDNDILLLPNGAYTGNFTPADRDHLRRSLGLPLHIPLIAYTGSLFFDDAVLMSAAFEIIQRKVPEAKMLMIGYTNIDLKKMVSQPETVINTGPVPFDELSAYVSACTIGWIPLADVKANTGRFPMKVNDFMAAGRAVVVSDVGDLGTMIGQYSLGLVSKPNAESLAANVLELLAATNRREGFEKRARETAETVFAWSKITDRLERFYYDMLSAHENEP